MLLAAQSTASMRSAGLPQASIACRAALTAISASTDSSSFGRSARRGAITAGSSTPALSITKRLLMPEAFSMNSGEDGCSASTAPAAMSAACSALKWAT